MASRRTHNSGNKLSQIINSAVSAFNNQNKITQQLLNNLLSQMKNPQNAGQYLQSLISNIKSPPQTLWGKIQQGLFGGPNPYKAFAAYQNYQNLKSQIANSNLNNNQKNILMQSLNQNYNLNYKNLQNTGLAGKVLDEVQDEFARGMMDVISGKSDFGDVMKSIGSNLGVFVLNNLMSSLQNVLNDPRTLQMFKGLFNVGVSGIKSVGSGLWGGFRKLLGFHDGGIVPTGMNYSLPGTQEQLALLKGGERILSPAENTSYTNNQDKSSSPIVVNNYTVKAWDSKDVSKYFMENKDLLNAITFDGIKRNSQQLRTMVQNA